MRIPLSCWDLDWPSALGLARRSSFHHKPRLLSLLLDRRDCETPRQKDFRTEDSVEDVLGVVMDGMGIVVVVVVEGEVAVEVVDEGYLIEVEVVGD